VEIHGGSFLAEETNIPAGADAYIMKHIIHDWNDEKVSFSLEEFLLFLPNTVAGNNHLEGHQKGSNSPIQSASGGT